ncbi:endonuclease/exonuclease/phosphatase family protein [Pseudonocardia acaciae]|uniref:endonuclease/exonuclease/phosphatase family protein n=1 Tax=Pseudonocardia acaciae TaxID=551276 RepID=UPI001B80676A|nr:endonuclease/exonuclease/phosphatase family protein [Pseudonocardia acaciae]
MNVRLRVLTVNVQNGAGDPRRTGILADGLRRLEPDVVAFQEVLGRDQLDGLLDGTGLSHRTHQADVLAYEPPFADRYGGNAVASRWPHRVVEVLDQRKAGAPDVPWCTLAAAVEVPSLGEMLFIATTASWRLDAEAARERQALALVDLDARHRRELPTVIAGDLNASPDASSIRYLTGRQSLNGLSACYHDAWEVAGSGAGHTWSVDNAAGRAEIDAVVRQPGHRRRIDYVLVGSWHSHPRASARVRSATLAFDTPVDGVWPSDHYGVLVDLDVATDPDRP